jgi:hypothetical protein
VSGTECEITNERTDEYNTYMLFIYLYIHDAVNAPGSRPCTGTKRSTSMTLDIIDFLRGEYIMSQKAEHQYVYNNYTRIMLWHEPQMPKQWCQRSATEPSIPRQHHLTKRMRTQKVEALLGTLFFIRSASNLCIRHSRLALQVVKAGSNHLHRSPARSKRRRKGNPASRGITGSPCSWGIYS